MKETARSGMAEVGMNTIDFYLIVRIALVGILVSILNQVLKQSGRDELAFMSSLAGLILVLLWLLPHITDLFLTIQKLFQLVS